MTANALRIGKIPVSLLRHLLDRGTTSTDDLLLPPMIGEDAAVVRVPAGALVAAADPITLTGREIGRHAVVVNANDVAVMGARPRWFLAVLLLPPGTSATQVEELFDEMYRTLSGIGAVLVGGHTEVTPAVNQPVVVGQMLGVREDGQFVRTGGVRANDVVLQIGPAPIEGTAVLAAAAAARLVDLAPDTLRQARDGLLRPGISIVAPALRAAELGATSLHDPTEGGLSAGLYEVAEASGVTLHVDRGAVLWFGPGQAICQALGADPWGVLASGTLLAAFPPDLCEQAEEALRAEGYVVARIAEASAGQSVCLLGEGMPLIRYEQDEVARLCSTSVDRPIPET